MQRLPHLSTSKPSHLVRLVQLGLGPVLPASDYDQVMVIATTLMIIMVIVMIMMIIIIIVMIMMIIMIIMMIFMVMIMMTPVTMFSLSSWQPRLSRSPRASHALPQRGTC